MNPWARVLGCCSLVGAGLVLAGRPAGCLRAGADAPEAAPHASTGSAAVLEIKCPI